MKDVVVKPELKDRWEGKTMQSRRVKHEKYKDESTLPIVPLECRRCGCRHFEVIEVRPTGCRRILVKRRCRYCGKEFIRCERVGYFKQEHQHE